MKTAKEFWKKKFDEEPQTDNDKLAIVMMQEYADYISLELKNKFVFSDAAKVVTKAIREDKDLYIAYQANIAMPFIDEFNRQKSAIGRNEAIENIHQISNDAAKYFLDLWCKE